MEPKCSAWGRHHEGETLAGCGFKAARRSTEVGGEGLMRRTRRRRRARNLTPEDVSSQTVADGDQPTTLQR